MANYEATRYDFDGEYLTGIQGVNTGLIVPWSDTSTPSGFLNCDGSAVSRVTYAALFAVIGTTYGSGNGSTTFDLPNLSDNIVLGRSPTKALASTGGANTVAGTGNISATIGNTTLSTPQIASHTHPTPGNTATVYGVNGLGYVGASGVANNPGVSTDLTGGGGAHTHNSSVTFTGSASSVLQPYLTVKYIIKT
jgi:microcystin-dependent protein